MKRRDFLKNSASLYALASLPIQKLTHTSQTWAEALRPDLPVAEVELNQMNSLDFNGDDIHRPHDILWDIDGYIAKKGGLPSEFETTDIAIIGGGMSGLISAYYLQKQNFILLEQDQRLGGNSKGETYKDSAYSIGAAYMLQPDEGSDIHSFLKELGILKEARLETADENTVFLQNKFVKAFWDGSSDPQARDQFAKVFKRLQGINQNEDYEWEGQLSKQTDSISFEKWLQQEFGELHPHLKEYFQIYAWSSFCASIDEISAFQFLGFIAPETGSIMTFPGGNSYVAQNISQRIRKLKGQQALRSGCIVLRVIAKADSVEVLYEDAFGALKMIKARKALIACPKFVATKVVPQMPPAQLQAIGKYTYRAYVVTNVLLKSKISSPSYELFCMRGEMPEAPTPLQTGDRSFTDICFGSWAQNDQVEHSVLTLYHGLPYDGARQFLFSPGSHDKYQALHRQDIQPILKALGLNEQDVLGMRSTRWGHSLPIAQVGLIQNGIVQAASQSIGDKIFFANQDNWANPSFECAHEVALQAVQNLLA
jgi:hypothetical protein